MNWAQNHSFPKEYFRSSKLKGMAAIRHGAEGSTTKTPSLGQRGGEHVDSRSGWWEKVSPSMHMLFVFYFFPPPLSSPFIVEGEEAAGISSCILTAVLSGVRVFCGAHLGLQKIGGGGGGSPEGVTSLSRFQAHHSKNTKDTNVFCIKFLHRMTAQPEQGDLMHMDTYTCPPLVALCSGFTPSYKLASQNQNDASLLKSVTHNHLQELHGNPLRCTRRPQHCDAALGLAQVLGGTSRRDIKKHVN